VGAIISLWWAASPGISIRLLEPAALAVQLQNMDMLRQPIEKRAGETLALENARPFTRTADST
jgi:hypothetical protein